eukprot:TRINITY_DN14769_c0_g1_i1.p1 TRINITY_DN14769_c0_g1~~TRINITY_DN14769_c0_g1_i1.p1  ORF type:complete len:358 (+),score=59.26 TRINITY_DN14769_c0_g1_i1:73-1146(+)
MAAGDGERTSNPASAFPQQAVPVASVEELSKACAGTSLEDLRAIGARLARSLDQLKESHEDLQAERKELTEEGDRLRSTIELMVRETHKLNINMDNTVEPELEEGPFNFMGRYWDLMRPRDNQVLVTENIGELKRPPRNPNEPVNPDEIAVKPRSWSDAFTSMWQRFSFSSAVDSKAEATVLDRAVPLVLVDEVEPVTSMSYAPAAPTVMPVQVQQGLPTVSATETGISYADKKVNIAGAPPTVGGQSDVSQLEKTNDEPKTEEHVGEEKEDEDNAAATVLIEATLALDDGTVQICRVRARDRCKDAAARFVRDNSLKFWFEEPLNRYLMEVERESERFPAKVQGNLQDIRTKYANR